MNSLISLSPISFPASVALLVLLFGFLILSESILGEKKTKAIVRVIDVPVRYVLATAILHSLEYSSAASLFATSMSFSLLPSVGLLFASSCYWQTEIFFFFFPV